MTEREFDCTDCGDHIVRMNARDQDPWMDVCTICQWIRGLPEGEREQARKDQRRREQGPE